MLKQVVAEQLAVDKEAAEKVVAVLVVASRRAAAQVQRALAPLARLRRDLGTIWQIWPKIGRHVSP